MQTSPEIELLHAPSGVVRVASSREMPHPHLAIVGAVHGNERCGAEAITRLQAELSSGALTLSHGTLFLVHGNPDAREAALRHSLRGTDLNRLFDYRFIDELALANWTVEHHRALALRPLLESVDAVLDLHSATAPTPPFAIASRVASAEPFAAALGLDYVTLGWDGPGLLGDQVLLGPLTRRKLPAVAVECGQHDDPASAEVAYRCARAALAYFGLTRDPLPAAPAPQRLLVRAAIKRPSAGFRFALAFRGMEAVRAGVLLGSDEHVQLSASRDCVLIMPNDQVAVGDDMLYVAERL